MPLLPVVLVLACGSGTSDTSRPATTDSATPDDLLDDGGWLARASLDLRGVRPSASELQSVLDGDASVLDHVGEWVRDPRFPTRMAWLWNDVIHTGVWADDYSRFGELDFETWRALGQEPLQLIAAVIDEDRPFSDVLVATETRANAVLADLYGLDHASSDWGWVPYTDGRPAAGVLSTNTLWLRYTADAVNLNRTRANTVADLFLCADFLERDGDFSFAINAEDLADVERAVSEQPACLTCHAALDPLAAFFGGFAQRSDELPDDQYLRWSQHRADWFAARVTPSYYGVPGADLADLGQAMAQDPRFASCAASRFHEGLIGAAPTLEQQLALGARFQALDQDVRALVVELIADPDYRAQDGRLLHVEQLGSSLTDLLAWGDGDSEVDGLNALTWSEPHRLLGGGTDDDTVLFRNTSAAVGLQILLEWTARQAVVPALEADLARSEPVLLLAGIPTDEGALRDQLMAWHLRFLSRPVDSDSAEIDALVDLWTQAGGDSDPQAALAEVLGVLVRHPEGVLY